MSDFCNRCADEMWGNELPPDIDVVADFDTLKKGEVIAGYLCEGCGLTNIMRDENDQMLVIRVSSNNDGTVAYSQWEPYYDGKLHVLPPDTE